MGKINKEMNGNGEAEASTFAKDQSSSEGDPFQNKTSGGQTCNKSVGLASEDEHHKTVAKTRSSEKETEPCHVRI